MTDVPPSPPLPRAPSGRGLKIALAVSVALNLAVAGLAAGAFLREGPRRGMPRDLSFGPFSAALSPEDRKALREALRDRAPGLRDARAAAEAEFLALLDALRASPYDPAIASAALSAIEARSAGRLELGRSLIETRITEMSEVDRRAFADRLEQGLRRPRG